MNTFINTTRNPKNKKTLKKCFKEFVKQCILLNKDEFNVRYGSEYYDSFSLRFKDWSEYVWNKFIMVPFSKLVPKKYRLDLFDYDVVYGVSKPIHLMHHIYVNESILEYFLSEFYFEIVDEHLGSLETIYYIKKKESKKGD